MPTFVAMSRTRRPSKPCVTSCPNVASRISVRRAGPLDRRACATLARSAEARLSGCLRCPHDLAHFRRPDFNFPREAQGREFQMVAERVVEIERGLSGWSKLQWAFQRYSRGGQPSFP